jgi:hypothetical protein
VTKPQRERSARHAVRDVGAGSLWAIGATRPRWSGRGKLTIVTSHRVLRPDDLAAAPLPRLCVTPTPKSDWFHPAGELAARGSLGSEAVLGADDVRKSAAQLRDPFALRPSA